MKKIDFRVFAVTLNRRVRRAVAHLRIFGLRSLLRLILGELLRRLKVRALVQHDIVEHYRFLIDETSSPHSADTEPPITEVIDDTLCWVIPNFDLGSGGHLNIFRMIYNLESIGYTNHIVIFGAHNFTDAEKVRTIIREHFFPLQATVGLGAAAITPCEFLVATSWDTAYPVNTFRDCTHKLYFVQDFEPYFFSLSSQYCFAEATYRYGFTGITAGNWLAEKLSHDYGMQTFAFGFSYDKDLYIQQPRKSGSRRVFFYARHVTPRRGFELGVLALFYVHQRLPDVEFVLAGWDSSTYKLPFPYLNAGTVDVKKLPALYSQCDVALVISLTNLSLLPLELMASGCPVVSNRGPNVEWLLQHDTNARLADPTPQALGQALIDVLETPGLRQRLVQQGFAFAHNTDWQQEAQRVAAVLHDLKHPEQ